MEDTTNLEVGMTAFNEGRYETAIKHLSTSLKEALQSGNVHDRGLSIYFLECSKANYEDREFNKEKIALALKFFKESNLHYLAAQCCEFLSTTVDFENTKRLLEEARVHYTKCSNWTGEARTYRIESRMAQRIGDVSQARELLNKALQKIEAQPQGLETVKAELRKIKQGISELQRRFGHPITST